MANEKKIDKKDDYEKWVHDFDFRYYAMHRIGPSVAICGSFVTLWVLSLSGSNSFLSVVLAVVAAGAFIGVIYAVIEVTRHRKDFYS